MFYSNLVMYFIILTTAATLHAHGKNDIETAQQAADALRPLAGGGAYWLFTLGLVGVGMLAVPVLAGSCAYAIAEAATWQEASLNDRPRRAPRFYGVIAAAMLIGLAMNFADLNAVKMLFWAAVLNGVLAPPLVVLVVLLSSDSKVMGQRTNSRTARMLGWLCAAVMATAGDSACGHLTVRSLTPETHQKDHQKAKGIRAYISRNRDRSSGYCNNGIQPKIIAALMRTTFLLSVTFLTVLLPRMEASTQAAPCAVGTLLSYESNQGGCELGGANGGILVFSGFTFSSTSSGSPVILDASEITVTPDPQGLGGGFIFGGFTGAPVLAGQTAQYDIDYSYFIDAGPVSSGADIGMDPPFGNVLITEAICADSIFVQSAAARPAMRNPRRSFCSSDPFCGRHESPNEFVGTSGPQPDRHQLRQH